MRQYAFLAAVLQFELLYPLPSTRSCRRVPSPLHLASDFVGRSNRKDPKYRVTSSERSNGATVPT